jgi:polar amino acid transport system substrate-binding protein
MNTLRRQLLGLAAAGVLLLAGCASTAPPVDIAVRQALAPTGSLRVGVYPGSPTSMVRDAKTGDKVGVALNLGQALASRLGVPVQVVEFERVAQVVEAVKAGAVDFTFTNATETRARDVDFTKPMLQVELGYLVPSDSAIASASEIDRPGVRVGVTQGSSSQGTLSRQFRYATLVPATSMQHAQELLRRGEVQAYATNKAVLSEMLDSLPGHKILPGRWGEEHIAIAIPKGRELGMPFLRQFALDVQTSGLLQSIIAKSGLRGAIAAN